MQITTARLRFNEKRRRKLCRLLEVEVLSRQRAKNSVVDSRLTFFSRLFQTSGHSVDNFITLSLHTAAQANATALQLHLSLHSMVRSSMNMFRAWPIIQLNSS